MASAPEETRPRLVLIGASNISRSQRSLFREALQIAGAPADIYLAAGRGRSYGARSTLAGLRALPGVLECGLWEVLARAPARPTFALVTDVGNDVLYGFPAPRILGWVAECVDRLLSLPARVALTTLPMARLGELTRLRYEVARRALFPSHPLGYETMVEVIRELEAGLKSLARERSVPFLEPPRIWYGVDPVHVRWSVRTRAWREILALWQAGPRAEATPPPRLALWRSLLLRPASLEILGRRWQTRQPAAVLADGTTISLY